MIVSISIAKKRLASEIKSGVLSGENSKVLNDASLCQQIPVKALAETGILQQTT